MSKNPKLSKKRREEAQNQQIREFFVRKFRSSPQSKSYGRRRRRLCTN
jgi:hypothetical protein